METAAPPPPAAAADPPLSPTAEAYYRQVNQQRFTIELEFLSCLSSPAYLTYLHSLGQFRSASFLRYLAHLHQTWSQPKYVKYLRYPNALLLCKALVDNADFRDTIGRDGWEGEVSRQIIHQWAGSQGPTTGRTSNEQQQQQQHQQHTQQSPTLSSLPKTEGSSAEQAASNVAKAVKDEVQR